MRQFPFYEPICITCWLRSPMTGPPVPSIYSFVMVTSQILSSFGISYMISSINSSMIARRARAPVSRSNAFFAIASSALSSKFSFTSSNSKSF